MNYTKEQLVPIFSLAVQKAVNAFRNTGPQTDDDIEGLADGSIDAWDYADDKWNEVLGEGDYELDGIMFRIQSEGVPEIKVIVGSVEVVISVGYDDYGNVEFPPDSSLSDNDKATVSDAVEEAFYTVE